MLRRLIIGLIRAYQAGISPLLPATCRYSPSCSEYARVAVERFGPGRGSWMAVRRLLRCHPFGGAGLDPVPESVECAKGHDGNRAEPRRSGAEA
jgi:putative membrane protein insertion efficiency factor